MYKKSGGGIIPKGRVVLTEARTTSSYAETSEYQSDELIGKSVIDVNVMYNADSMSCFDRTLRVYADCSEGCSVFGNSAHIAISVEYISSTGTVKLQAYNNSNNYAYHGRVTAFYFE